MNYEPQLNQVHQCAEEEENLQGNSITHIANCQKSLVEEEDDT